MCDFCNKKNIEKITVAGKYLCRLSISGKSIVIEDMNMIGNEEATDDYLQIKFCPFCGKELNELK